MLKNILNIVVIILSVFYGSISFATCYTNQGGASPKTVTISPPTINVQRDTPVGTVIYSTATATATAVLSCTAGGGYYYEMSLFTSPAGIDHVYDTNIPGVGVRLSNPSYTGFFEVSPILIPNKITQSLSITTRTYDLIKTGPITSGIMRGGLLARVYGDGDYVTAASYNVMSARINSLACSINTPNMTFPIGDILVSKFGSSVGTIPAGGQNTQNLGLNCDVGTNINVSLTGTQNPDVGTTSVLALTNQGAADVAQGVGVQILYNGTVLSRNSNIVLKTSSGGQEMLPITARYYQTKTTVTTGTANATATLNLTYQ